MRNPFRRKALTGSPAVIDAIRGGWTPYPLLGGGSRQRIMDAYNTAQSANYSWIYQNSPAVRTVVDVLVRNIGQLDLRLYEEIDSAERQPRPEHPAALSLRYPSETETSDGFIRALIKDFLLYDNAYALLQPAPGNQLSLFRVPAHMVEIRGQSLFAAEGYRIYRRDGTWVDYAPDQILHWRGENPDDPRMGLSRLDTLRSVLAEDTALQQAIVELALSGLTEPTWVSRPLEAPEWSNEARKGFEEDLTNRLRRRNKTPVVLEEGMELKSFGVSPRDAQMFEVRRWAIQRVAAVYGVPLGMIGLDDNLDEAQKQFYADTLPPYCEEFTKMLNQRILVRVYNWTDGCFEFNLHEKQIGPEMINTLISAAGGPIYLRDEARALLSQPPLPDGQGAKVITPMNVTEGGKPSPQVMPVQDANKPEQDGSYRESSLALTKAPERLPQLHPTRKSELDRQHRNIDLAQAVVRRHFNRLERSLRNKAGQTDWRRWDQEFADDINQLVQQIVETEGTIYAFKLAGTFDLQRVLNYLLAMAEGAAEGINTKVREEITTLGLENALALSERHVESAGAGLGAAATIWAREEAARQSPGTNKRVKVWIPNTDRHAEFAGQTVPLGANWPGGFAPGTEPGCRCTLAIE